VLRIAPSAASRNTAAAGRRHLWPLRKGSTAVTRPAERRAGSVAAWLAVGGCLAIAVLTWFGYQATLGWQQSSVALADRRATEAANLLVTALTRDMRGVQTSVLGSPLWQGELRRRPADLGILVASAFARYPYPESFFVWQDPASSQMRFFNRSDRRPAWLTPGADSVKFPVIEGSDPELSRTIATRIAADGARGRRFSAFEMTVAGDPYQIVASILYDGAFGDQLVGAIGFTVNLRWAYTHYFPELTQQVSRISGVEGLALAVTDDRGTLITGVLPTTRPESSRQRPFTMMFLDPPTVALDPPSDLPQRRWTVHINIDDDPALVTAMRWSYQTLVVTSTAAVALALGLILTARGARAVARLSDMRSELVSTVTHELKTPIAAIRAIGETMVTGRVSSPEATRDYARLVVKEAKRLTRLVDNLLAYARITDVTDAYSFEALDVEPLVDDALRAFSAQLAAGNFAVTVQIPRDLPRVRADKASISLLLDNLLDNAIRYSRQNRSLQIRASAEATGVLVEVTDMGAGIPPDEIDRVVRKFVRGRHAGSSGTGLGLAIANRIVRDHGGLFVIRSTVDVGTTVAVTLPYSDGRR
jgi:signal transduction histidine kinase